MCSALDFFAFFRGGIGLQSDECANENPNVTPARIKIALLSFRRWSFIGDCCINVVYARTAQFAY